MLPSQSIVFFSLEVGCGGVVVCGGGWFGGFLAGGWMVIRGGFPWGTIVELKSLERKLVGRSWFAWVFVTWLDNT